jgi:hypothetical protein
VSIDSAAASSLSFEEDNLHELYRRTVVRVDERRRSSVFPEVQAEDVRLKLQECVCVQLRDAMVSNGAATMVAVMLSYALEALRTSIVDEESDDAATTVERRRSGLRLLREAAEIGRWLVYDANTAVQETLLAALADRSALRSTSSSHSVVATAHPGACLLSDLRGVVELLSASAQAPKTLFTKRPDCLGVFSQNANALSSAGARSASHAAGAAVETRGAEGVPSGDAGGTGIAAGIDADGDGDDDGVPLLPDPESGALGLRRRRVGGLPTDGDSSRGGCVRGPRCCRHDEPSQW